MIGAGAVKAFCAEILRQVGVNLGSDSDAASTTGSAHAKLKALRSSPISPIKSIQRGTTSVGSGGSTVNVTIGAVTMDKTVVHINTSGGPWRSGSASDYASLYFNGFLQAATNLRLYNNMFSATIIAWEVIEYN